MIINFTLNGKRTRVEVNPMQRLADTLRVDLGLTNTKAGCYSGECGTCIVLLDGELVHSCLVPAFSARARSITTIEGISATITYRELIRGFEQSGLRPCRSCFQGRLLTMYHLLESTEIPTKEEIEEVMIAQRCRCIDHGDLLEVLEQVIVERRKRQRVSII